MVFDVSSQLWGATGEYNTSLWSLLYSRGMAWLMKAPHKADHHVKVVRGTNPKTKMLNLYYDNL